MVKLASENNIDKARGTAITATAGSIAITFALRFHSISCLAVDCFMQLLKFCVFDEALASTRQVSECTTHPKQGVQTCAIHAT